MGVNFLLEIVISPNKDCIVLCVTSCGLVDRQRCFWVNIYVLLQGWTIKFEEASCPAGSILTYQTPRFQFHKSFPICHSTCEVCGRWRCPQDVFQIRLGRSSAPIWCKSVRLGVSRSITAHRPINSHCRICGRFNGFVHRCALLDCSPIRGPQTGCLKWPLIRTLASSEMWYHADL